MSKIPELVHGISKRHYGNMNFARGDSGQVIENREHFLADLDISIEELIVPEMVHGSKISSVSLSDAGMGAKNFSDAIKGADGLVTRESNLFLMVTLADCLPILAYDPIAKVVGICHAGWRGVLSGIVKELVHKMIYLGSNPGGLIIGIGPGICQKHFVVKNDLVNNFSRQYPSATFVRNKDGYVDLKKAAFIDLTNEGVQKNNIETSDVCTACQNGIMGSHRVEGAHAPAAAAIIGIRG